MIITTNLVGTATHGYVWHAAPRQALEALRVEGKCNNHARDDDQSNDNADDLQNTAAAHV
jgi:hypothetical protein